MQTVAYIGATDRQLIPSAKPGHGGDGSAPDERIFSELVSDHGKHLYRFILKHIGQPDDAEDLAQQAFLEAYTHLNHYRGESKLSTWLYGISMNLVRNYLSRSPARRFEFCDCDSDGEDSIAPALPDQAPGPEEISGERQIYAVFLHELNALPAEMREVLLLVGQDGLSYEEAAELLVVPVGTVRSRLSRANLKQRLSADGVEIGEPW